MGIAIAVAAVSADISTPIRRASAQAPANSGAPPTPALKTPWGEPDLQGIWTDETDTPLQRPARYANQEVFTEAQRAEIDRARSELLSRERRAERGTERDVSGSYNNVFVSFKRTGRLAWGVGPDPNDFPWDRGLPVRLPGMPRPAPAEARGAIAGCSAAITDHVLSTVTARTSRGHPTFSPPALRLLIFALIDHPEAVPAVWLVGEASQEIAGRWRPRRGPDQIRPKPSHRPANSA
jgi:hypothetical protein